MSTDGKTTIIFPTLTNSDINILAKSPKTYCRAALILRYAVKMSLIIGIFIIAEILYIHYASKLVQQKGFWCNDESLRNPFLKSYLTMKHVFYLCLIPPFFIILIVEWIRLYRNNDPEFYSASEDGSSTLCRLFVRVCLFYSYFFAAVVFDLIVLFFCKFWFGRLRPHFIEVCKPNVGYERCEVDHFITDYHCTGEHKKWITNARMSFFSGHSSLVATTATFLCIYVQNRLSTQIKNRCVVPLIHLLLLCATLLMGYSRIVEYKHHVSDVLAGFLVGVVIAGLCTCNAGLNKIPNILRWRKMSFDRVVKVQPVNLT